MHGRRVHLIFSGMKGDFYACRRGDKKFLNILGALIKFLTRAHRPG